MKTADNSKWPVWTDELVCSLYHDIDLPCFGTPFSRRDVAKYVAGQMAPSQHTEFEALILENTALAAYIKEVESRLAASAGKLRTRLNTLLKRHAPSPSGQANAVQHEVQEYSIPPEDVQDVVKWAHLPLAAESPIQKSTVMQRMKLRTPESGESEIEIEVRLAYTHLQNHPVYLSAKILMDDHDQQSREKARGWTLVSGTVRIPLVRGTKVCTEEEAKRALNTKDWKLVHIPTR